MGKPRCIDDYILRSYKEEYFVYNLHQPGWWAGTQTDLDIMHLFDGSRIRLDVIEIIGEKHRLGTEGATQQVDEMLAALERQGFLAEDGINRESRPYTLDVIYLHLTRRCNLGCKYCYLSAGKGLDNELSTEEMKQFIDQMRALAGPKQGIAVTGGEPMLHPDFWEILDYLTSDGEDKVSVWLATNGTLVTPENASELARRFVEIQISLDGSEAVHDEMRGAGTYAKAIRAIELLADAGANVKLSATLSKKNLEEIYQLVDVAEKYGIKGIKTGVMLPFGKADRDLMLTPQDFENFWVRMQKRLEGTGINVKMESEGTKHNFMEGIFDCTHSCGAGINSLSMDSDGSIYPCQASHFPEFKLGNVRDSSLQDIWKSDAAKDWSDSILAERLVDCQDCMWLRICGGGCRMQAYAWTGEIDRAYPFCNFTKKFMEEGVQKYLQWLLEKKAKDE